MLKEKALHVVYSACARCAGCVRTETKGGSPRQTEVARVRILTEGEGKFIKSFYLSIVPLKLCFSEVTPAPGHPATDSFKTCLSKRVEKARPSVT